MSVWVKGVLLYPPPPQFGDDCTERPEGTVADMPLVSSRGTEFRSESAQYQCATQ